MKYITWFESIAFPLQDTETNHEFSRYTKKQMVMAFNAGMAIAHSYREDLFTEYAVIKLQAGKYQDGRGCCLKIMEVFDQTDENGNTLKELEKSRKTDTKVRRHWNKPSCLGAKADELADYEIESVKLDMNMDGRFVVEPAVPCDTDAYVRVKCVQDFCDLTEAELNNEMTEDKTLISALWHYVLGRLLSGDRYQEATYQSMQYHIKLFFDILGITTQREELFESPENATKE